MRGKHFSEDIYLDDESRADWVTVSDKICGRFNWVVHAYCQMTNHYHVLAQKDAYPWSLPVIWF